MRSAPRPCSAKAICCTSRPAESNDCTRPCSKTTRSGSWSRPAPRRRPRHRLRCSCVLSTIVANSMDSSDLREWLARVEELGELRKIDGAHWKLEMGALTELLYR